MNETYQLWHCDGTRSLRVIWLAEEMGIADRIQIQQIRFPPRIHAPEYLEINPLGSLPFFKDGGTHISESIAICLYLLARNGPTPLAVEPHEPGFGDYLQLCLFGEATLMPPVGAMVRYHILDAPEKRSDSALADARRAFSQRQVRISQALEGGKEFLVGDRFTLADIAVGYTLGLVSRLGERALFTPDIDSYFERLRQRPAMIRALAV